MKYALQRNMEGLTVALITVAIIIGKAGGFISWDHNQITLFGLGYLMHLNFGIQAANEGPINTPAHPNRSPGAGTSSQQNHPKDSSLTQQAMNQDDQETLPKSALNVGRKGALDARMSQLRQDAGCDKNNRYVKPKPKDPERKRPTIPRRPEAASMPPKPARYTPPHKRGTTEKGTDRKVRMSPVKEAEKEKAPKIRPSYIAPECLIDRNAPLTKGALARGDSIDRARERMRCKEKSTKD